MPSVNGQTLSEWFGKAPKNSGTKSWKFFKERYVHDVLVAPVLESLPDEGKASVGHGLGEHIVYGRCHRSMKKNESPHSLNLKVLSFEGRAQVITAHCSCIAGCGGICNHIFALLYQMVDYFSDDLQQIPIDVSKTSRPTGVAYSETRVSGVFACDGNTLCKARNRANETWGEKKWPQFFASSMIQDQQ